MAMLPKNTEVVKSVNEELDLDHVVYMENKTLINKKRFRY